jgi:transposase
MLSTKKIAEMFDVPKTTLYGWKAERPKVYEYLAIADEQFSKYRDVNILLDRYIQTVSNIALFEYKELEYILELKQENLKIEELDNFHLKFIEKSIKIEKEPKTFALDIYKK